MKCTLYVLFMFCCMPLFAQNGITFEVEKLSKPKNLLYTQHNDDIFRRLIIASAGLPPYGLEPKDHFPYKILAKSEVPDSLVSYGSNSFFDGMHRAYADHRPFVLSPDIIWLLISQGVARHMNENPEMMRRYLVNHTGKIDLIVESNKRLDDPTLSWEKIFPEFMSQIKKNVKGDLVDLLTCDFSTTTTVERVASEITIMEATKPYFEFIVLYISCGIPEITLEGKPEDWVKILNKARGLKAYGLEWWIDELEPVLAEFVKASNGNADKDFWRNMFKFHTEKEYGAPMIIDGWIVKFFPYDKHGKRNNLKELVGTDSLPEEVVKVDLKFIEASLNGVTETIPLELWAGFVGLDQNKKNFALRPQIGWMIRKKDGGDEVLLNKLCENAGKDGLGEGVCLRVKEFPAILLKLTDIKFLQLKFSDEIDIPDDLVKVQIKKMELSGKINDKGIARIKKLFPKTNIWINNKLINGKDTRPQVPGIIR